MRKIPSHNFLLNCPNSHNPFVSQIWIMIFINEYFILFSINIVDLLSGNSNFHLAVNCLRECTSADLQCNYFPLEFPKLYHSGIFYYG